MGNNQSADTLDKVLQKVLDNLSINPISSRNFYRDYAYRDDVNEWISGLGDLLSEEDSGKLRFRKAMKPDFISSGKAYEVAKKKAKEKGIENYKPADYLPIKEIEDLNKMLDTPVEGENFEYKSWDENFGKGIDNVINKLDKFNELTDNEFVGNPEMSVLKYAVNKLAEVRALFNVNNPEYTDEERIGISEFGKEKKALDNERKEIEKYCRDNNIRYFGLQDDKKFISGQMDSNQKLIDTFKKGISEIENSKKLLLQNYKKENKDFDKEYNRLTEGLEKQKQNQKKLESEIIKFKNTANVLNEEKSKIIKEHNIPQEDANAIDKQARVENYLNTKGQSFEKTSLSGGAVKLMYINEMIDINPENKQFNNSKDKQDYEKELMTLDESQLKKRMSDAFSKIKEKGDECNKKYPDYQKAAQKFEDNRNQQYVYNTTLQGQIHAIGITENAIEKIEKAVPGYEKLNVKQQGKEALLLQAEKLLENQKELLSKMEVLSIQCDDFSEREKAFKDKYADFARDMAKKANENILPKEVKQDAVNRFKGLAQQLNKFTRAGHSNTDEFNALSDALKDIDATNDLSGKLKDIKIKADTYLKKKKDSLNLNTKMRRQRLDAAKAISQLAGSLLKVEQFSKSRGFKKTADRINEVMQQKQLLELSTNVNKNVRNTQKRILADNMEQIYSEHYGSRNMNVQKKPMSAGLK